MSLQNLFKASLLTAALAATFPALASDYYVVVPVPNHTAAGNISVALAGFSLPAAQVGQPYAGFDFKSVLSVTGDAGYNGYGVRWSIASGSLPAGLTLNSNGTLSGTPTAGGSSSFQVMASYKTKAGQQSYQIYTADITVGLSGGTPPQGFVGRPYSYDLRPLLTVSGDSAYTGAGVAWTVVSSTLPAGLYLTNDGFIGGTPSASGSGSVTARATYKGVNGQQTYQVVTQTISVTLGSTTLPAASQGLPYAGYDFRSLVSSNDPSFQTSGTTWSVVDALPAGLALDANGVLSGTPSGSGSQAFTLKASFKGYAGQQTYTLVSAPSSLLTASVPSLDFPSVSDYTTVSKTVTLTNTGDAAGTLSLASDSTNFTVSGCSTIPAKGSCTATVSFYPTGVTSYAGHLSITGATSGALTVPLTGTALLNVQTFTASTSWTVPAKLTSVKALVVGGGGGAQAAQTVSATTGGLGGGGGQVLYNASYTVTPNSTMAVVVGDGGSVGQDSLENGQPSSFGSLKALGGYSGYEGGASGSGYASGGYSTATLQGGGGGGAGGAGGAGTTTKAGDGGPGICFSFTGSQKCYGGGGAGGTALTSGGTAGAGGLGGGGAGGVLSAGTGGVGGTPNTGGGGAGGTGAGRGAGGSGVVVVAY
jgi:hypothetical protein